VLLIVGDVTHKESTNIGTQCYSQKYLENCLQKGDHKESQKGPVVTCKRVHQLWSSHWEWESSEDIMGFELVGKKGPDCLRLFVV
jgi:hypothetical protein